MYHVWCREAQLLQLNNHWPGISKAPQGQDGPSLKQAPIGDDAPEGRRHIGEDHLGGREHGHTTQG